MLDYFLYPTVIILSYLFGNLNFAVLYSKLLGRDIRTIGSGNPGSMNMIRNFGKIWGAITLSSDVLKGVIPSLFGWFLLGGNFKFGADRVGLYVGALSLIIGHIYPVFYKFKGGKGIASTIGICAVINFPAALAGFLLAMLFIQFTKCGTIGSFVAIGTPLITEAFLLGGKAGPVVSIIMFLLLGLTLFAHRKNIVRLFTDKESKTKLWGKKRG